MGLLDDAIREHLELKRRRGADATEVARQEQEAFGPSRRGDAEAAPHAAADTALDEPGTFAADDQTALHVVPEPAPLHEVHPVQDEESRFHGDPADDLPRSEPRQPGAAHPPPEPAPRDVPPVQEGESRFHGDPADDLPEVEQATEAFNAEEIRAATTPPPAVPPPPTPPPEPEPTPEPAAPPAPRGDDPEGDPEDVLEETPEFLQETPEHDRLWFEQRPPRDFDF